MNKSKYPPVDLEKYLEARGRKHHYVTYEDGARALGMAYWGFVRFCQEIGANIPLRKTSIVDMDIVEKYIEKYPYEFKSKSEGNDMPKKRKKIDNIDELVNSGKKKYVRIAEGAELYSVGKHTFESWVEEAKAARRIKGVVLVNTDKIDAFIESFEEDY